LFLLIIFISLIFTLALILAGYQPEVMTGI